MKITLRASGLMKSGPERELVDDYMSRAQHLGRSLGILDISESAIDTRSAKSRGAETQSLLSDYSGARLVVLDERGKSQTSRQMAQQITTWRDAAEREIVFAIGGADGFEPADIPQGATKWSFGSQVWPHKLVRVMMAEQIYRSLSIMARTPYHRD